jgi:AcrR family transcriptional regulator
MPPARSTPKPKRPRRKAAYHHGNLHRALLDAALALVEERGIHGFTLREAARRAGVSQAAPYRHFVDKAALLMALAEEGFRALTARMLAEVAAAMVEPGLKAAGLGYLLFAAENPAHYRVMFGPSLDKDAPKCATTPAGRESFQVLLDAVEQGQRARVVRAGDVREIALFAWSIVHGLAALVIDGQVPVVGSGIAPLPPTERAPRSGSNEGQDALALRALAARVLTISFDGLAPRKSAGRGAT